MTIARNGINRLLVGNDHTIFPPFIIRKICVYPIDNIFYLWFPFREILRVFHHIPGAGHSVYLCFAPFTYVFKKWPPLIILYGIFSKPCEYLCGGYFISSRIALIQLYQIKK